MSDDLDFYRSAQIIIDQYGDRAVSHAAKMSKEMAAKDDTVGYTMWELIRVAIDNLLTKDRAGETTDH